MTVAQVVVVGACVAGCAPTVVPFAVLAIGSCPVFSGSDFPPGLGFAVSVRSRPGPVSSARCFLLRA